MRPPEKYLLCAADAIALAMTVACKMTKSDPSKKRENLTYNFFDIRLHPTMHSIIRTLYAI